MLACCWVTTHLESRQDACAPGNSRAVQYETTTVVSSLRISSAPAASGLAILPLVFTITAVGVSVAPYVSATSRFFCSSTCPKPFLATLTKFSLIVPKLIKAMVSCSLCACCQSLISLNNATQGPQFGLVKTSNNGLP